MGIENAVVVILQRRCVVSWLSLARTARFRRLGAARLGTPEPLHAPFIVPTRKESCVATTAVQTKVQSII